MTDRRPVRRLVNWLASSLRLRLVASFLTLSSITVALVAAAAFQLARSSLRAAAFDRLAAVAADKEGELNQWLVEREGDVVFLAGIRSMQEGAAALASGRSARGGPVHDDVQAMLDSLRGKIRELEDVSLLSAIGGMVLLSTDSTQVGSYRVSELFFHEGREGTFVHNVHSSPRTGRPAITIATPVPWCSGSRIAHRSRMIST